MKVELVPEGVQGVRYSLLKRELGRGSGWRRGWYGVQGEVSLVQRHVGNMWKQAGVEVRVRVRSVPVEAERALEARRTTGAR